MHLLPASNLDLRRIILMTRRCTSVITTASRVTITAEGNNLWDVRDPTKKYQDVMLGRDISDCICSYCYMSSISYSSLQPFRLKKSSQVHVSACVCIKFCTKREKTRIETYGMIRTVFPYEAMCWTQVSVWLCRFEDGHTPIEDNERWGRPSSSSNDEVGAKMRDLVTANRILTLGK